MKKYFKFMICAVVMMSIFLIGGLKANAQDTTTYRTTANLNVRTGGSTQYRRIGVLSKGEEVEVIEINGNWAKIKYEGRTAYSCKLWLEKVEEVEKTETSKSTSERKSEKKSTSEKVTSVKSISKNSSSEKNSSRNGNVRRTITVEATAYTGSAEENGGWANMTSTGAVPREGRTIAVDPRVIPYGTRVYIPALGGTYVAEDCGGAIKGNRIDIFMNTSSKCNAWGRRHIEVQILE